MLRDGVLVYYFVVFFFQAEDGIRDSSVTGVQTCALPILRVHSHAGLDGLSCPRGQTETFVGIVIRGSRTNIRRDSLTVRAVVLTGRVGGRNGHSHMDSYREIENPARSVKPYSLPPKVPVAHLYP